MSGWLTFKDLAERHPNIAEAMRKELAHPDESYTMVREYSKYVVIDDGTRGCRVIFDMEKEYFYYEEFNWATGRQTAAAWLGTTVVEDVLRRLPANPAATVVEVAVHELRLLKGQLQTMLIRINDIIGEE